MKTKKLPPDPYLFIKSIAEQGYSLSTAIADLIDNSIAAGAKKIELLVDCQNQPFKFFIADNGNGMCDVELIKNMRFPSSDMSEDRQSDDLGRFGLGLKTASFSQTRKFTVLSRIKGGEFHGCTWDLDYLKKGEWELIINSDKEIKSLLNQFKHLSTSFIGFQEDFIPNTIVIWEGLYKIERLDGDAEEQKNALYSELSEDTSEHLGLIFHRFIEKKELTIRLNNGIITPFLPFPAVEDLRALSEKVREYKGEQISIQGYILPARAIKESKEGLSIWTQNKRSLTDMEGIYVYRKDRLIIYGGWNRLVKKTTQFQLGRIMVQIGNKSDELFQLNVSKSNLKIPYEIKRAFLSIISEIKSEAFKEYKNRVNKELIERKSEKGIVPLLKRSITSLGTEYNVNEEYPLYKHLSTTIDKQSMKVLQHLIRNINKEINEMLGIDERRHSGNKIIENDFNEDDIKFYIELYTKRGFSKDLIIQILHTVFGNNELIDKLMQCQK
ncbi:MAG TPA: ATP-binding protein [Phnomibacter sp.]|nr:ATP-binding protein [Phnomibacter sp.]